MTPVYAFDIDGVLCDTRQAHRAALEAELGVTLDDGTEYGAFGFHHPDPAVMARLREVALDLWRRPTVCANGDASGQDVVRTLAERGQLAGYVTRRHPDIFPETFRWLKAQGFVIPSMYDRHPVCPRLHHMLGDVESKAEACRRMGATHLIEDSASEALGAAKDGLQVVVVRRSHNRDFEREHQQETADLSSGLTSDTARRIRFISDLEELL